MSEPIDAACEDCGCEAGEPGQRRSVKLRDVGGELTAICGPCWRKRMDTKRRIERDKGESAEHWGW